MKKLSNAIIVMCLFFCCPVTLISQEKASTAAGKKNVATQPVSISTLQEQLIEAFAQIENLGKQVSLLKETDGFIHQELGALQNANRIAIFDPADLSQFQRINSDSGFFVISLDKVEPYLDGYKLTIEIGNLCTAKYDAFKLDVTWAPKYRGALGNKDYRNQWVEAHRNKQFAYADTLIPGQWNRVELVLPNTKASEFGYIQFGLATANITLQKQLRLP